MITHKVEETFDVIIIGAGAAGLTTAVSILREKKIAKIALIDKNKVLGKKLYATGNGKCNLTNMKCSSANSTLAFFNSIGLLTKEKDEGRIYPYSEQAKDVVEVFRQQLNNKNVKIALDSKVTNVKKTNGEFIVEYLDSTTNIYKQLKGNNLVIATGGKASPIYGTTGDGYIFAKEFGHAITSLAPALTPIESLEELGSIKGVRSNCLLKVCKNEETIHEEYGQVQFMEYGISGIVSLNCSQFIEKDTTLYTLKIDFLPNLTSSQVEKILSEKKNINNLMARHLLLSVVNENIAVKIFDRSEIDYNKPANIVTQNEIEKVANELKNFTLSIKGLKGWKEAQITKGGVLLDDIEMKSMESKLVDNLYFVGEILNLQGPSGGYNLQIAWETGIGAGKSILKKI